MTLTESINEQLQKAPADQAVEVQASDEKLRVVVKLAECARLGCLLDRLQLEHTQDGHVTVDPDQIVRKITYLGERLEVIETEGQDGKSIIRSTPPRVDGDLTSFFEMVLDRSEGLHLLRYKVDPKTGERTPMAAPLTRDTLERLISDLIALTQKN